MKDECFQSILDCANAILRGHRKLIFYNQYTPITFQQSPVYVLSDHWESFQVLYSGIKRIQKHEKGLYQNMFLAGERCR